MNHTIQSETNERTGISLKEFILMMAFLMSLTALSIDSMLPGLSQMGADLGSKSDNQSQSIIAFLFFGLAAGLIVYGPVSDCIGRKKAIYIGLGIFACGSVISAFAHTMELMLTGRFIQGLGVAGPRIIIAALVRDHFKGREMARVMSFVISIFILMPAVAPLIGQGILHLAGWRMIFVFFIMLSILAYVWVLLRLSETVPKSKQIPFAPKVILKGFSEVLKNRLTIGYTVVSALSFAAMVAYIMTSPQLYKQQFAITDTFPAYFAITALVVGAAAIVNAKLVIRFGMRNITMKAFGIIACASIVYLSRLIFIASPPSLWGFVLYSCIVMFAMGLTFGNLNALALETITKHVGIAAAVVGALNTFLSTLIGAAIGQIYKSTPAPIIAGYLVLSLLALSGMYMLNKINDKEGEPDL